jgi:hypothetical protein
MVHIVAEQDYTDLNWSVSILRVTQRQKTDCLVSVIQSLVSVCFITCTCNFKPVCVRVLRKEFNFFMMGMIDKLDNFVQNSFHQQIHPLLNIQNVKTYN